MSKESILDLYTFAKQLNDDNLTRIIWRWFGRKPHKITDPLLKIIFENEDLDGIIKLLQKDYISINEERIFKHCLNWLKKQYLIKSNLAKKLAASSTATTSSHDQPRDIIQPILEYIRFPIMSLKFISTNVYNSGVLTEKELLNIYRAKHLKDSKITRFNMKRRKRRHRLASTDENDDDGFDGINMAEIIDDELLNGTYKDITSLVQAIGNSGEYSGYPMVYMYSDDANYWCSCDITTGSDVWIIFDCQTHEIGKIEVKFQASYACSVIKVYSSDSKRTYDWDKVTKRINMTQDGQVKTLYIQTHYARFMKLKFEDWINGYVGIERVKFYSRDD